jgi:retinol dehydrogenase 12
MATNCLAPYLLTLLLEPLLTQTAASSSPGSIRVIFVVALMQHGTPPGAMSFDSNGTPAVLPKGFDNYMHSKVGGTFLADAFAKRFGGKNILSLVSPRQLSVGSD